MSKPQSPFGMQRERADPLIVVADRLRQALAEDIHGHEREWGQAVANSLAHVETAVWQHRLHANAKDGSLATVDNSRPTLARQVDALRSECDGFLMQATALREEAQRIAEFLRPKANPSAEDLAAMRQLAEQFLDAVEKNKEAETRLVLESVNTDIGVCD